MAISAPNMAPPRLTAASKPSAALPSTMIRERRPAAVAAAATAASHSVTLPHVRCVAFGDTPNDPFGSAA